MRNFFKGLLAVILGVLVIILLYVISYLLIGLLMYILVKIPLIGGWFSRVWFRDLWIECPSVYIAYGLGGMFISKISGEHTKTAKISLTIVGSLMIALHTFSALISIIALIWSIECDTNIFANIANILGGVALIYCARDN